MDNNRRIMVTGGAGFLGRQVIAELRKYGAGNIFVPRSSEYDLTKEQDVKRLFHDQRPDLVIHMAAEVGGIGANRENPGRYFYANLMMGTLMMENARLSSTEKFVAIGTICSYPKFTPTPFLEDDLWGGYPEETNAPYGLAKKMMLVQSQAYRDQYQFNSIYLLPVNLYGPGDNFDLRTSHVIPALIRKCVEAKESGAPFVEVWGTGNASREFLFVEDAARGIVSASFHYDKSDPVNLGAGREITIRDLVHIIAETVGYSGEIVWNHDKPDGQPRRCLDVSRARTEFGFEAQVQLEEGIKRTVDWYLSNR